MKAGISSPAYYSLSVQPRLLLRLARAPRICALATLAIFASAAIARTQTPADAPKKLRVGVFADPPFAIQTGGMYSGYAIELWDQVALRAGWAFEYEPMKDVPALLDAVHSGRVDTGISSLAITSERLKQVDFSHPFCEAGLQVMVNTGRKHSLRSLWDGLVENGHLRIFGAGAAFILVAVVLLTILDRWWDRDFHQSWREGLAESFFHVMSLVFTGKTTHKGIPGSIGKILAGLWAACGVAIVAYITSTITSVMTANALRSEISGPRDLAGRVVGTIRGSAGDSYASALKLDVQPFENLDAAVAALVSRRVDVVLHDAPALHFYDNAHPELPLREVGAVFDTLPYGFALPPESGLRIAINRQLLVLRESGETARLNRNYFGMTE